MKETNAFGEKKKKKKMKKDVKIKTWTSIIAGASSSIRQRPAQINASASFAAAIYSRRLSRFCLAFCLFPLFLLTNIKVGRIPSDFSNNNNNKATTKATKNLKMTQLMGENPFWIWWIVFGNKLLYDDPNELTEIECVKDYWLIINSIKAKDNQISSTKRNGGLILLSVACAVLSQSRGSFQLEINVRVFYTSCLYKMIVDSSQEHCWGRVSLAKDISDSRVESCIIRFISPVVRQQQRRSIVVCPPSDIELILLSCLPSFSLSLWRSLSLLAIAQAPSFPSFPPQVAPDSCWRLLGPPFGADAEVDFCGGETK